MSRCAYFLIGLFVIINWVLSFWIGVLSCREFKTPFCGIVFCMPLNLLSYMILSVERFSSESLFLYNVVLLYNVIVSNI